MTHASTSPVQRETCCSIYSRGKRRAVIVRIEGGVLRFRLWGTRQWHTLAVESGYWAAVKVTAEGIKKERKAAREARRLERVR